MPLYKRPTPAERFWQLCEGLTIKIDKKSILILYSFLKEKNVYLSTIQKMAMYGANIH